MGRITSSQNDFSTGEVSPRIYARSDVPKYGKALETATNCKVTPHGPIERRSGTKFVSEVKDSTKTVKLIRFQISQADAFMLEFGNEYIRFYTEAGQVLSGGSAYEIASPYLEADLPFMSVTQFGDIVYLANKNYAPRTLTRTDTTDWTLEELETIPPATYEPGYSPDATVTPAATTGLHIRFTAGSASFLQGDIGRQITSLTGNGRASIVHIHSSTQIDADIVEDFPSTSAIASGDWLMDLSPIAVLDADNIFSGSIAKVISRPVQPPELLNGNFDTSASYWANKSELAGTIGWDSTNRNLELVGGGTSNQAIAEQPINGVWEGNFKIKLNIIDNPCSYSIGTTSGGTDLASGSLVVGTGQEILFTTSSGTDTVYVRFRTTAAGAVTSSLDRIELTAELDTFRAADIGSYILLNGGVMQITAVTNAANIECEILKSLNDNENSELWTLEKPTWSAARGYPRAVGLYQQRLVFGGTTTQPQTLWMSESGIFEGFGIGPDAEDAIQVDLSSSQINTINWIATQRDLIIGTAGAEATVSGGSVGSAVTPSSIQQTPRTYYGSDSQQPIIIGSEVIFLQGAGRKIRTFGYDFGVDGYKGEDLTFLAEHITEGVIRELAYTQDPDSIIYAVDALGNLLTGTYQRDQEVIGWSNNTTTGLFENVATMSAGAVDQVWVVVNRTIEGATKRYIELLDTADGTGRLDGFSDSFLTYSDPKVISAITQANPGVVTSAVHGFGNGQNLKLIDLKGMTEADGITYVAANVTENTFELTDLYGTNVDTTAYTAFVASTAGAAHKLVTIISGLDHLEGEVLQIKADGGSHTNQTVTSGTVSLDAPSYAVVAGLEYTTTLKTLRKEFTVGSGTMQGEPQRHVSPIVRVYKSALPILNGEFLPSRSTSDRMDEAVPLYTGDLYYGPQAWSNSGQLTFTTSEPLPLQLQGIFGAYQGDVK
jgi:hypothetical protein